MNWLIEYYSVNDLLLVAGVMFLSIFVQSLAGFGSGLVAMPLLVAIVGLQAAVPLYALVSLYFQMMLLFHFRESVRLPAVLKVSVPALMGIPLGIVGLAVLDEGILLGGLGMVLLGYGAYSLFNFHVPEFKSPLWAYGAGFIGGLLGGAYNAAGPPVILYADSQRWPVEEFKANLQGFFLVSSSTAVIGHGLARNLTTPVLASAILVIPAVIIGYWAGLSLEKRLNQAQFRQVVLVLLMGIGIRLMLLAIHG